ncbi:TPA: hypothetical protein HNC37_06670 [Escherichia coli]|nr:hypothetical protein [Escherichia coli]
MVVNDVNDGAKNARFWCALRQNGAVISSKFVNDHNSRIIFYFCITLRFLFFLFTHIANVFTLYAL